MGEFSEYITRLGFHDIHQHDDDEHFVCAGVMRDWPWASFRGIFFIESIKNFRST
jgi:hypothetical protein